MLATISRLIRPAAIPRRLHHPLLAQVIEAVGNNLAQARDLEAQLVPAIQFACDYFDDQIASIPGPLEMSAAAMEHDPLVATLFPTQEVLDAALSRSIEVKESLPTLAGNGHQHVHALLGMRARPADDSSASQLEFADHTVRSLAPKESDARDYLRLVAFSRLVKHFVEHLERLRRKEKLQKLEQNLQNEVMGSDRLAAAHAFAYVAKELTPDNLLKGLVAWLTSPENHFRVDRNGVSVGELDLPLLHTTDRRQWLVCIVRFSCLDGLEALSKESRTHRYILI